MVWKCEVMGDYTVKTGYKLLLLNKLQIPDAYPNSMIQSNSLFYTALWTLQLPGKILLGHLPNNIRVKPYAPPVSSFPEYRSWLDKTFRVANEKSKKLLAIALWAVWLARNRLVHDGVQKTVNELVGFIFSYLREIEEISHIRVITVPTLQQIWRPPDPSFIKINSDSSYNSKTHSAISGILERNHLRQIMEACTYPTDHVADAFIVEARASEQAIWYAIDMGFRKEMQTMRCIPWERRVDGFNQQDSRSRRCRRWWKG
ncbi:hypothetical protein GOBAR_DD12521 [Gossypium barbadense]|nr:hypothetical protein GOBAR_DD12521 [Gossypium barbadense]